MGGHSLRGEMLECLDFLNSNLYMDAVVQKRRAANENAALVSMVDRSEIFGRSRNGTVGPGMNFPAGRKVELPFCGIKW